MALATGEQQSGGFNRDANGRLVVTNPDGSLVGSAVTVTVTDPSANALATGAAIKTAGASAVLIAANGTRKGLQVTVDPAATQNVYFLLGAGTASATNFHFAMGAGGSWDGTATNTLWTGAVQFFSSGTPLVGVAEV